MAVPYFHMVFTLPKPIADITYQNKAAVYDILFKAAAERHRFEGGGERQDADHHRRPVRLAGGVEAR